MDELTPRQAYGAMILFLQGHQRRTKSSDVAALLSDLSFLADGGSADPAAYGDWLTAVVQIRDIDIERDGRFRLNLK